MKKSIAQSNCDYFGDKRFGQFLAKVQKLEHEYLWYRNDFTAGSSSYEELGEDKCFSEINDYADRAMENIDGGLGALDNDETRKSESDVHDDIFIMSDLTEFVYFHYFDDKSKKLRKLVKKFRKYSGYRFDSRTDDYIDDLSKCNVKELKKVYNALSDFLI